MPLFLFLLLQAATAQLPGTLYKANSVLKVELNGQAPPGQMYPCITSVAVQGRVIVPPIAVGALFQMDTRSYAGDNYNPTQSGACYGQASQLDAWQDPWGYIGGTNNNGVLMGITPRTFLSSDGQCTNGEATPYYYNWGIQLGDGVVFPEQAMVIVQTVQKTDPNAPEVVYEGSELPTVYYDCGFAKYAFYMPNNDFQWQPLIGPSGDNYVPNWSASGVSQVPSFANMRCDGPDPTTALCAATYTNRQVGIGGGNNGGGGCNANLVSLQTGFFNDTNVHSRTAIFAVGTGPTVSAALSQTAAHLSGAWGDL